MAEHETAYDNLSHSWHPVSHQTPLDQLIADEEGVGGEKIDVDGIREIPRDALKRLVRFLVPEKSISPAKKWRQAQIRLVLVAQMLDVDDCGGQSFEELAQELGCTRSLLCHYSMQIIDGLGINKTKLGKARSTRSTYSRRASEVHQRLGHRTPSMEKQEA